MVVERYNHNRVSPSSTLLNSLLPFDCDGTASLNGVLGHTGEHLAVLDEAQVAEDLLTFAVDLDQIRLLVQVHDRMLRPRHRACVQIGVACGLRVRI
jgi:hypothetical protein